MSDLQKGMQAGTTLPGPSRKSILNGSRTIDREGPALRSVIEVNPDALSIADALDRERKEKRARAGPLHGIPLLIKDNIDTADGMATTAGSLALLGSKPPTDAFLVHLLRAAGAVILGKTNLSEWANIRSSRSTSGWSGRGGLTRNPYALDRNTSGSSSGSAAAVAVKSLCRSHRHRDGRVHCKPVQLVRHRRVETDSGIGEPDRNHPHLAHAGYRGTDGAYRPRCRNSAGCDCRADSEDAATTSNKRKAPPTTPGIWILTDYADAASVWYGSTSGSMKGWTR